MRDISLLLEIIGVYSIVSEDSQSIKFDSSISENNLIQFLKRIKDKKMEFEFYDEFYLSPSDPGAYISYSSKKIKVGDKWQMTLGNHGWSGGIYLIEESTLIKQLMNLIRNNALEINVDGVCFFSHYTVKPESKSLEMEKEILKIHT
jgi:hypothetical protein